MNANERELILKEEVYVGLLLNFGAPKLEWKRMVLSQLSKTANER